MKAKELMLFDLIRRKKDGKIMTVVELRYAETIAAITPDDVYYGDMEDYHESEIEPILITPEILEKNGFTNGEFYAESHIEDWQIMSDGSHLAARSERGWCIDIPCRYVHELQHFLRLVNYEKEIVL